MLRKLQQQFLEDLFSLQANPISVQRLLSSGRRSPLEQFVTYRDSVLSGIIGALKETYPVCHRLVGERFFDAMVMRFICQNPSVSPDLNAYGGNLGDFIDGFTPAEALPYLGDVARLEWAWQTVTDSLPVAAGNLHTLAQIAAGDLEKLRFKLFENSTLLASPYPIDQIWLSNRNDTADETIELDRGGVKLLIWTDGKENRVDRLNELQWCFLTLLDNEPTFGHVCVEMRRRHRDVDLGDLLGASIQQGWLSGFVFN